MSYLGIYGAQGGTQTHESTDLQSAPLVALVPVHVEVAYPEGFEPPLAVLETVVLPLTLGIHIEFESSSAHVIGTIHLIIQGRQGLGTPLGILDKGAPMRLRDSNPSFFFISRLFEEAF